MSVPEPSLLESVLGLHEDWDTDGGGDDKIGGDMPFENGLLDYIFEYQIPEPEGEDKCLTISYV